MTSPVVIFSLPRSGSTLLQRMLSTSPAVSTVTEPWVLLPPLYALREEGVYTEYSHRVTQRALEDLLKALPGGRQDYLDAMATAARQLYVRLADKDARYFIDKTPRYALVADDVIRMFGDGKFIFLWRNPLAVIASMIETWGEGRWNIYLYRVDLYDGLARLVDAYRAHGDAVLALNYEALVTDPETGLRRVTDYLGLAYDPAMLADFAGVDFPGEMGDPTGVKDYRALSTHPLGKWKSTLCNPLRRRWCRRYLDWIGRERLRVMGYELDELQAELATTANRWTTVPGDLLRLVAGVVYTLFDVSIIRHKLGRLFAWRELRHHN